MRTQTKADMRHDSLDSEIGGVSVTHVKTKTFQHAYSPRDTIYPVTTGQGGSKHLVNTGSWVPAPTDQKDAKMVGKMAARLPRANPRCSSAVLERAFWSGEVSLSYREAGPQQNQG